MRLAAFQFDDLPLLINIGIYDGMPDRYTVHISPDGYSLRNEWTKSIF